MKASNSKSQLVTQRLKSNIPDSLNSVMLPPKRRKSQTSSNNLKVNKSKSNIQVKDQSIELSQVKTQQLFSIIETFYNTLCSLPMEMLMNSSDPQFWLKEQQKTLKELQKKLQKHNKSKDFEYYKWKLQSVDKLLSNIAENMGMLQRITHMKGYYSGTDTSNYRSRGNSSVDSGHCDIKVAGFASGSEDHTNEMISYDRYEIKQNKKDKSYKTKSPEIMAQTVQSDQEMSDDESPPMISSEVFHKKRASKRQTTREGENINHSNVLNNQFLKQTSRELQTKDKTLAKVHPSKAANSERTLSNYTIEDRFRTAIQEGSTSRDRLYTADEKTIDDSKQLIEPRQSVSHQREKEEFIAMIKELRMQLVNKDREIENLLINQQEHQQGIEIFQEREKEKNMEIVFMKENVTKINRQKEKLQLQIKRLSDYHDDLKETIKYQRERNRKAQIEKKQMEERHYEQLNNREQVTSEISQMKEENKLCKKNERVMKEKLEIYTKKYFNLYGQFEQEKQTNSLLLGELEQLRNRKGKNNSKYDEIKEIVEYHKEKLFDESF